MNGNFGGGSGTVDDPYLVEDVYDFCAISAQYYKLVKDIDFNNHDTYKNGFNALVCRSGAYLDGNGKKVRNIVVTSGTSNIMSLNAHDVDFENIFVIDSKGSGSNAVFNGTYTNCRMYIRLINSSVNYAIKGIYDKCAITITGDAIDYLVLPTLSESHMHLKNLTLVSGLTNSSGIMFGSFISIVNMKKSYITGDITTRGTWSGSLYNNEYTIYPLSYTGAYKVDLSYFAFKVNIVGKEKLGDSVCSNNISCLNGSFFDYELMGYENKPNGKGLVALTTAESKDVDVLNANGFLCVKV